ncbi:hypothetical protein OFN18_26260, partial [Escherichia coli]|nr:hypothetical protein [Escherichia coli]
MAASVISPLSGLGCFAVLPLISDQKLTPVSLSSQPVDGLCNGYFAFASARLRRSSSFLSAFAMSMNACMI